MGGNATGLRDYTLEFALLRFRGAIETTSFPSGPKGATDKYRPQRPMAASSFRPSPVSIGALRRELQLLTPRLLLAQAIWNPCCPQPPDSNDRLDGEESDEWMLHLTLGDIQEIEDAVAHFERKWPKTEGVVCWRLTLWVQGMGLPLNQLKAQHFPLPSLGLKLRERSMLLHKEKPFFLLRGIGPQWFSKRKNVIVFLGIASHIGTHRAFSKGDHTVLREF